MRNYETRIYDFVDKKTGCHVVKATTMYAGKSVSAVAKCMPGDEFDLKFGTDVALKRLDIKIALKRAASMKAYAEHCRQNIEWHSQEKYRLKRAGAKAEEAMSDRLVDANQFEKELEALLANH